MPVQAPRPPAVAAATLPPARRPQNVPAHTAPALGAAARNAPAKPAGRPGPAARSTAPAGSMAPAPSMTAGRSMSPARSTDAAQSTYALRSTHAPRSTPAAKSASAGRAAPGGRGKSARAAKDAEHEILFQKYFKSVNPQRTYASQVKKAGNGNHYVVFTEGRRDDATGEVRKTRLFVYSEDFIAFFKMLQETSYFIRDNPVPEEVRQKRHKFWARKDEPSKPSRDAGKAPPGALGGPPPASAPAGDRGVKPHEPRPPSPPPAPGASTR